MAKFKVFIGWTPDGRKFKMVTPDGYRTTLSAGTRDQIVSSLKKLLPAWYEVAAKDHAEFALEIKREADLLGIEVAPPPVPEPPEGGQGVREDYGAGCSSFPSIPLYGRR